MKKLREQRLRRLVREEIQQLNERDIMVDGHLVDVSYDKKRDRLQIHVETPNGEVWEGGFADEGIPATVGKVILKQLAKELR